MRQGSGAAVRLAPAALLAATALIGSGALAACRARELPPDAAAGPTSKAPAGSAAPAPAAPAAPAAPSPVSDVAPRLTYPPSSGGLAELIGASRLAVVSLRAKAPVKGGPAAMFPGASDAVADVALGTGFLVEAKGPHVLTTDRIAAASAELVAVQVDGSELAVKVIGRDPRLDVALLAVTGGALRLPALSLGDSDRMLVGERVLVLGNPFGDEVSATAGIVSATGRDAAATASAGGGASYRTLMQTDARIHRGNSGGPVLDAAGAVVGIATATGERPTELSFVIPINRVKEILDSLRDTGRATRAWLGAMVKPITVEQAKQLGLDKPTGALVTQVLSGSPAQKGALQVGDVVTRWSDRDVDARSMPWIVAATPPGKPVRVVVWRAKASVELAISVEPMPQ